MTTHSTIASRYGGACPPLNSIKYFCVATTLFAATTAPAVTPPGSAHHLASAGHASHHASNASVPTTLAYRSVFERYQSFRDEKIGSWREANDVVTRVGGWREYLKEAQRPDAAAVPVPESSARPALTPATKPDPHAGHGVKK